jgi:hypothetical protein
MLPTPLPMPNALFPPAFFPSVGGTVATIGFLLCPPMRSR